jgi:beta-phosphoglucomutase
LPRAAIWDMDGVLVDSGRYHYEAWRVLALELGREFGEEQFWPTFGRRNQEIIREYFGDFPPDELERLAAHRDRIYLNLIPARLSPMPGALALLRGLAERGYRQAVASSSPFENVHTVLEALGIKQYFSAVITAENVKAGKPNPEVFLVAARALQVAPTDCVVFEDAVAGVVAAKAAGARCIAVTTSRSAEALARAQADLVVSSLTQVTPDRVEALLDGATHQSEHRLS